MIDDESANQPLISYKKTREGDQKVIDKLFSKESPLSLGTIREVTGIDDLSPTHRVFRMRCKDLSLMHSLEKDSLVYIFYQQTGNDVVALAEKPYEDSSMIGLKECNDSPSPIDSLICDTSFYIILPIDYSIREDIETEFLYDTFIPQEFNKKEQNDRFDEITPAYVTGVLQSYDNRLGQYIPLAYVRVSYLSTYMGSPVFAFTTTDAFGGFRLDCPYLQSPSPLTFTFVNSKFIVRSGLSPMVYSFTYNSLSDFLPSTSTHFVINRPIDFICDVYKAAQYYFYRYNDLLSTITRYDTTGKIIDIFAINSLDTENEYLGYFMPSDDPYIVIYNPYVLNYTGACSKVFGTVLHELGHATHYATVGKSNMNATESIITESFASFFGWFNVSIYYASVASSASVVNQICTQGRQNWTATCSWVDYSPFYIDLYDDYNQKLYLGSAYNNDPISNLALSAILSLSLGPQEFRNVYYPLAAYIGSAFTGSEYTAFVEPYSSLVL